MAKIILESDVCIDGFLHNKVEYTDRKVIFGNSLNALKGQRKGRKEIEVYTDADGDIYTDIGLKTDPDFMDLGAIRNAGVKNLVVWEIQEDDATLSPIPCGTSTTNSTSTKK